MPNMDSLRQIQNFKGIKSVRYFFVRTLANKLGALRLSDILVEEVFAKYDTNNDGKIPKGDLLTAFNKLGLKATKAETDEMVKDQNCDGSSMIKLKDFSAMAKELHAKRSFQSFDKEIFSSLIANIAPVSLH